MVTRYVVVVSVVVFIIIINSSSIISIIICLYIPLPMEVWKLIKGVSLMNKSSFSKGFSTQQQANTPSVELPSTQNTNAVKDLPVYSSALQTSPGRAKNREGIS